jgi:SAM-dependent methyltransferase
MGDIRQLRHVFAEDWDWSTGGEEWSSWWGGTPALWYGALLPRIHSFIPAGTILEIAPGFGRWTQYLKSSCERLILVDLAPKCIEHCRARFSEDAHIEYHVNDGRSLDMVEDGSLDFVFSWDSLVHADRDILDDYVRELSRKLAPNGVAFLHHSNVASQSLRHRISMRTPERVRRPLVRRGVLLDVYAWRSPTVDAASVADMMARHGLVCVGQEVFSWEHGPHLTEAISLLTPAGSRWARPGPVITNRSFRRDGARMARLYAASSFRSPAEP